MVIVAAAIASTIRRVQGRRRRLLQLGQGKRRRPNYHLVVADSDEMIAKHPRDQRGQVRGSIEIEAAHGLGTWRRVGLFSVIREDVVVDVVVVLVVLVVLIVVVVVGVVVVVVGTSPSRRCC